ncbi:hypothetical protein M5689_024118 [Euphorbia peplus]|nr:hypothetical protein M5689_024118 [Euphorbia peplus]
MCAEPPNGTFIIVLVLLISRVNYFLTFLNCLRFLVLRIAYFILWTSVFVIFQWIIHACISMWWPYPFLDLSFPCAPLWYMGLG